MDRWAPSRLGRRALQSSGLERGEDPGPEALQAGAARALPLGGCEDSAQVPLPRFRAIDSLKPKRLSATIPGRPNTEILCGCGAITPKDSSAVVSEYGIRRV